jgi:hypothetical protein
MVVHDVASTVQKILKRIANLHVRLEQIERLQNK